LKHSPYGILLRNINKNNACIYVRPYLFIKQINDISGTSNKSQEWHKYISKIKYGYSGKPM